MWKDIYLTNMKRKTFCSKRDRSDALLSLMPIIGRIDRLRTLYRNGKVAEVFNQL
jgi:hypothetical protein